MWEIFVGVILCISIAYLYTAAFIYFPKQTLYSVIAVGQAGLLAGAIAGISIASVALFLTMFLLAIINAIAVYCCFQSIKTGMALVGGCRYFMKSNLPLLGILWVTLIFSIGISIFHGYGLAATHSIMSYNQSNGNSFLL